MSPPVVGSNLHGSCPQRFVISPGPGLPESQTRQGQDQQRANGDAQPPYRANPASPLLAASQHPQTRAKKDCQGDTGQIRMAVRLGRHTDANQACGRKQQDQVAQPSHQTDRPDALQRKQHHGDGDGRAGSDQHACARVPGRVRRHFIKRQQPCRHDHLAQQDHGAVKGHNHPRHETFRPRHRLIA